MNIDEDRFTYDLMCAISEFAYRPTKNMIVNDYASLLFLNEIFAKLYNKCFVLDNVIKDYERAIKIKEKDNINSINNYLINIFTNKKVLYQISKNYINYFNNQKIGNYQYFKNLRNYSKEDFIDIILSYYSTFGDKIYNILSFAVKMSKAL